jgi:hypothetical protein
MLMKSHSISPVISFCSNEMRFLGPCLESLKDFSCKTCIVVWDHFFDGTVENRDALFHSFHSFPNCQFLLAPFVPHRIHEKFKKRIGKDFWFNCSRMVGAHFAQGEYLLFLDIDEILDSQAFFTWLDTEQYREYDAMRLENYWYFRLPTFQATQWEDSAVLARKGKWQRRALHSPGDRHALYQSAKKKMRHVLSVNHEPMIHHYSWVRTKEEILQKMKASAHRLENDWEALIEKEWSKAKISRDFVHGYELKEVASFIDLDLNQSFHFQKAPKNLPPNVVALSSKEFLTIIGLPFWKRMLQFYSS